MTTASDVNKHLKIAVCGCGHIGQRHAEMVSRHKYMKLTGLIDVDIKAALAEKYDTLFYTDLANFIDGEKFGHSRSDVIAIATPNGFHYEQVLLCLQSGYHVVIEKPMCFTKQQAEHIIQESISSEKCVFCVMQNRYSPPSTWFKELMESNILGDIYLVQLNCMWNRDDRYYKEDGWHGDEYLDGGSLYTQFSHFIDLMYWYFGDICNIKGAVADYNHQKLTDFEDTGSFVFDFIEGGMGTFTFTTAVHEENLQSNITVIAENGTVKIGGQYMNEVEYCNIKHYDMPALEATNAANDYGPYKGSAANHCYVYDNVYNHLLTSHVPISCNMFEGMKVIDIIERLYSVTSKIK